MYPYKLDITEIQTKQPETHTHTHTHTGPKYRPSLPVDGLGENKYQHLPPGDPDLNIPTDLHLTSALDYKEYIPWPDSAQSQITFKVITVSHVTLFHTSQLFHHCSITPDSHGITVWCDGTLQAAVIDCREHPTNVTSKGSNTFLVWEVTFYSTYWYVFRPEWVKNITLQYSI